MEYYSAITKNKIMLFAGKSMEVGIIMSSEGSQAQKYKCHMFSLIHGN
jgi:ribosomal protein L30E